MKLILIFFILLMGIGGSAQKNPKNLDLKWKTDTTKASVPLNEFLALMHPDGIPPIDKPYFLSAKEGSQEYFQFEPIIAVEINGESKAYPLSILMYHEIVNDSLGGIGITVTFCPLCNSAVVFNRELTFKDNTYFLDFGVSGMLRNSDMVMYDRQTESWWQQFTGEALVGDLVGAELEFIPAPVISIEEFVTLYPTGKILTKDKNTVGEETFGYGTNPYVGYDNKGNDKPRLFFGEVDDRLPAMTRVVDVIVQKKHKIYRLNYIRSKGIVNDKFQEKSLTIFYSEKVVSILDSADITQSKTIGAVNVFSAEVKDSFLTFKKKKAYFIDKKTKSKWNMKGECFDGELSGEFLRILPHGTHFAFAMFSFYPECEVFVE